MTDFDKNHRRILSQAIASWFVRKDTKYYDVTNYSTPLSREDVQQISIQRFVLDYPEVPLSTELLRAVFKATLTKLSLDPSEIVNVWNGKVECRPDIVATLIPQRGTVSINSWIKPAYRNLRVNQADLGIFGTFLEWVFPRPAERETFLNWTAWCLQNEHDKPNWAPLLFSRTKGSGKSTMTKILIALFGEENSYALNSTDKLTARFNREVLLSKLVVSEELQLRPGSTASNAMKTYLTEKKVTVEAKNQAVTSIDQLCCFVFTTNHMPIWIEDGDRRFYVVEVDHDGHASGPRSQDFAALAEEVNVALTNDAAVASLYAALMERAIPDTFSAKTLNTTLQATEVMRKIQAASGRVTTERVREHLEELGVNAIAEADLVTHFQQELRVNPESLRHHMVELGWHTISCKWGGVDYPRSLWLREGYTMYRGKLRAPGGTEADFKAARDQLAELAGL